MSKLKRFLAREEGIAMATVVAMIAVLTVLSIALIDQVTTESNRAASAVSSDAVYQAAEAGINDYVAKLLDDPQYYDHYVAAGESTRRQCTAFSNGTCTGSGSDSAPGSAWSSGTGWTYPFGKNTRYQGTGASTLIEGYAYNLMISPPSTQTGRERNYVTVVSTGCQLDASGAACNSRVPNRSIEIRVRRTTPADFAFMYGDDQNWGTGAVTYGKVYVLGNICHDGIAHGDLMAEGTVNASSCRSSVSLQDGADIYTPGTTPSIRTVIKKQVPFDSFAVSLTDIKSAAQQYSPGGVCGATGPSCFTSAGYVWSINFLANGTYQVKRCSSGSGGTAPSGCGTAMSFSMPANGAIYANQTAIIAYPSGSVVNGRVTVASNTDIVVAGNIHYQSEYGGANDDVLGLIGNNHVYVADYSPTVMSWRAAVLAERFNRQSYSCPADGYGPKDTVTFYGSVASNQSGCMTLFDHRNYYDDPVLKYLFPPWYPVIDGAESTVLFREVPPSYAPSTATS
jgi:Tfp pilus assembly protein PilX